MHSDVELLSLFGVWESWSMRISVCNDMQTPKLPGIAGILKGIGAIK